MYSKIAWRARLGLSRSYGLTVWRVAKKLAAMEVHDWAQVHRLFEVEGLSGTRIAEKLEMSRNTVAKLLRSDEPRGKSGGRWVSKLDAYKGSIQVMLGEDPKAPATVIIERLRREGYDGGITILKDYLREVRPLLVQAKAFQRTSYLPGEIGQCDWWEPPLIVPGGQGSFPAGVRAGGDPAAFGSTLVCVLVLEVDD